MSEPLRSGLANAQVVLFRQDLDLRYTWIFNPQLDFIAEDVLGKRDRLLVQERASRKRLRQFLALVAHDLRSSAETIYGFAQLLARCRIARSLSSWPRDTNSGPWPVAIVAIQ